MKPEIASLTAEEPLRRLLDPAYPLCRDDVKSALGFIKKKVADGAPEWSGLDRPQLLAHFVCFADMALLLINRHNPSDKDTACFRAMLRELLPKKPPI
ncbi:hypothetical protein [Cohnella yongneupensis]|uniref:Uncharacterized protein n=1 Tax=Cohnella yongneupensis TaxID=425006 RepID=A0ABW0R508_9BACL